MKAILTALAVVLILTGSRVEAAEFTHEQIDKIMAYVNQNPAASPENTAALPLTPAMFQKNFNAEVKSVLDKAQFDSAEDRAVMEKIFLIQDFQAYESNGGKFYLNVFGNRVAIFGVTANDNNRFKFVSCAYTMPETQDEKSLSSLILVTFAKVVALNENPQNLLSDLAAEQSGSLTRNGVTFSALRDNDLILLSVTKAAD